MKTTVLILAAAMVSSLSLTAAPLRVALMDTEDLTAQKAAAGYLPAGAIAQKGAPLIGKFMLKNATFNLIDRRDFTSSIDKHRQKDSGHRIDAGAVLQAARALRADAVMKSAILSLSAENRTVNQGGYNVELRNLTIRVMIEVLDPTDGSVVGMADGTASRELRLSPSDVTTLGEEELLQLFESAVAKAAPEVEQAVLKRMQRDAARERVTLTVKTSADPAMIEIDGMLVGTTPLDKIEVYAGDHIISVVKPGYHEVSKRILIRKDTSLSVPMLRNELTMEELKEIAKEMSLNRIAVMQPAWVIEHH
jgi:hypothetical protein